MTASLDGTTFDIETAIKGSLEASMEATKQLCHDYPLTARVVGGGAIVAGSALLAPAAIGVAGFGAAGIVKGSLAAFVQSYVYGGATGGIFAAVQSYAALNVAGVASTIAGGLGLAGGAVVLQNIDKAGDHSDPPGDIAKLPEGESSCDCAGDNLKSTAVEDDRDGVDRKEEADNTHQEDYTIHYQVKL